MVVTGESSFSAFYHNKRILITGASGYIAWNLIKQLMEFDCTIICFSTNINNIEKQKGRAKLKFINGSYQDEKIYQKVIDNIDIVYHLASQTSIYKAENNPIFDFEANVRPMLLLLEACRKGETCPIIIFSGTSTQCGIPEKLPVDEKIFDDPITTYDFHKLQAERWLKFYSRQGWVRSVSFRLTNVYGPGPKSSSADRGIMNLMIKKALNGEELTIYGKGEYIRDYIYIDDVISAFLSVSVHINEVDGKHFVLGSGIGTTIHNAIRMVGNLVGQHLGKKIKVKSIKPPSGLLDIENRNFIADISSLCNKIAFKIKFDLKEGIKCSIISISAEGKSLKYE